MAKIAPTKTENASTGSDFGRLVQKANEGDEEANRALWQKLDAEGRANDFVRGITDNGYQTRELREKSLVTRTAFQRKMKQMRQELGVETASPLEKLLIERIVLCWYHLYDVELSYTRQMRESISLEKATYYQKALDRAERRYQEAVKSLAVLRRLQVPVMQINIGEKQVNIAQGVTKETERIG